jgi:hypothetical protein
VSLNPIPGATVTISLNGSPGTLSGVTNGTTGSDGAVSFSNLKISRAGSYSLNASTPSATGGSFSGTSSSFTVYDCTTAYPCSVAFSAQPASAVATKLLASDLFGNDGATNPVKVLVKDQAGVSISGRAVTVSLSPNSGALSGTTAVNTDSTGTASFSTLKVSTSANSYALTAKTPNPTSAGTSNAFGVFDTGQNCPAGQLCDQTVSSSTTGQLTEVSFTSQGNWGLGVSLSTSPITETQWTANCGGFNMAPNNVTGQPFGVPSSASGLATWIITISKGVRLPNPDNGVSKYRPCYARPQAEGSFNITSLGASGAATGTSTLISTPAGNFYIGPPVDCPSSVVDVCLKSVTAGQSASGNASVIEKLLTRVSDPHLH